jgi:pimeloyl-ACP methyl ester carboxylesterase
MTATAPGGRSCVEWLVAIAAIVVGLPAAAWFGQEKLIFFPQAASGTSHLPAATERLELVARDGTRLAGFVVPGDPRPAPALLYFGGNAEEISWSLADGRWPRAWTLAGVNYRGYGTSEGRPGERELKDDGVAAFDALAARADVDPRRIVVVGRSLGTGVAVHVAAARPVAGAILVSPFDSLVAIGRTHYPWLPVDWLLRHRFDSGARAGGIDVPLLAIVGAADGIIPPTRSRALFDAWSGPKTWVEIPGAGHNDLGSTAQFWAPIATFLAGLSHRS